LCNFVQI